MFLRERYEVTPVNVRTVYLSSKPHNDNVYMIQENNNYCNCINSTFKKKKKEKKIEKMF